MPTIIIYKTGAPNCFFWSDEDAKTYHDPRNRTIRRYVDIPTEIIDINEEYSIKKKHLYYISHQDIIYGIYSSLDKVESYCKMHDIKLGWHGYRLNNLRNITN